MRKNITPHFSYKEMTDTDTGLPNIPSPSAEIHLVYLCRALERIRYKINLHNDNDEYPLVINSGYRTKEVNEAVNGSRTSYHLDGRAADISTENLPSNVIDKLISACYDEFPSEVILHHNFIHFAI